MFIRSEGTRLQHMYVYMFRLVIADTSKRLVLVVSCAPLARGAATDLSTIPPLAFEGRARPRVPRAPVRSGLA